jgi:transposase
VGRGPWAKSKSSILFVGLDVHKESIAIGVAHARLSPPCDLWASIGHDLAALDKALRRLTSAGHELRIVYEAGP